MITCAREEFMNKCLRILLSNCIINECYCLNYNWSSEINSYTNRQVSPLCCDEYCSESCVKVVAVLRCTSGFPEYGDMVMHQLMSYLAEAITKYFLTNLNLLQCCVTESRQLSVTKVDSRIG